MVTSVIDPDRSRANGAKATKSNNHSTGGSQFKKHPARMALLTFNVVDLLSMQMQFRFAFIWITHKFRRNVCEKKI